MLQWILDFFTLSSVATQTTGDSNSTTAQLETPLPALSANEIVALIAEETPFSEHF